MSRRRVGDISGALDGLIAGVPSQAGGEVIRLVSVDDLRSSPFQPRRHFDQARLEALTQSVRAEGILQPLLARSTPAGLELVAGERRLRAARLAQLAEVPVVVRDLTDQQAALLAAVENLQREDLSNIEEVDATAALVSAVLNVPLAGIKARLNALTHRPEDEPETVQRLEALFASLGRGTWQSFTRNKLRILGWPPEVLGAMREHALPYTLAGIVAAAPEAQRSELLRAALSGATHAELKEQAEGLAQSLPLRKGTERNAVRLSKLLGSRRRVAQLNDTSRKRLNELLAELEKLFEAPGTP